MNIKINKAYFIIPLVYAAVIIFLLYMQFSGSSQFTAQIHDIQMFAKTKAGAPGRDPEITNLLINCSGVDFSFGKENPLVVFSQDGLTHKTTPVDYRVTATGIDIKLTKDINLSFYYAQNKTDLINVSISAGDPESIKFIHLPVLSPDSELVLISGTSVLSVKSETDQDLFINFPGNGDFNSEESVFVIYPEEGKSAHLSIEKAGASGMDAVTFWTSGDSEIIAEDELKKKIDDYITISTKILMNQRFSSSNGTWLSENGRYSFSEEALVMAGSETTGTSEYAVVKELLNRAAEIHSSNLSIKSSPLFGNPVNIIWEYDEQMIRKPEELISAAEKQDFKLFSDPYLTAAVLEQPSSRLTDSVIQFIAEITPGELSLVDALNIVSFVTKTAESYPSLSERFGDIAPIIREDILSEITIISEDLFVSGSDKQADIYMTLKTGTVLRKFSTLASSENATDFSALGRELVNSALALSDDKGFLPSRISIADDKKMEKQGTILPETVYPLLTDNTWYPSEDFFVSETGKNISVINQADDFRIEKTRDGYKLVFFFPAGQTHIFAVRNVDPFYQMNLLGYIWNPDHRFLNYSSGWWFDRAHNTLFVKIKHRQQREEILITTDRPAQPPAPAPAPAPETEEQDPSAENTDTGLQ